MQINLLLVAANATVSATIATTSTSGSSTSSKLLAINQITTAIARLLRRAGAKIVRYRLDGTVIAWLRTYGTVLMVP